MRSPGPRVPLPRSREVSCPRPMGCPMPSPMSYPVLTAYVSSVPCPMEAPTPCPCPMATSPSSSATGDSPLGAGGSISPKPPALRPASPAVMCGGGRGSGRWWGPAAGDNKGQLVVTCHMSPPIIPISPRWCPSALVGTLVAVMHPQVLGTSLMRVGTPSHRDTVPIPLPCLNKEGPVGARP